MMTSSSLRKWLPWNWHSLLVFGAWAAGIALFVVVLALAWHSHQEWRRWCEAQGGRVDDVTRTHSVTTWTDGRPSYGTASETTYYCLSADGRILDIK